MTEKKTCYNCGNKNCHIFYFSVKQDVAEHHETYEYTDFSCVNHDKWKELKVEEIRTDSTKKLKNALERITDLEKENAELKNQVSFLKDNLRVARKDRENLQLDVARGLKEFVKDYPATSLRYLANEKYVEHFDKAKDIIRNLLSCLYSVEYDRVSDLEQAEQFLKEVSE